VNSDQIGIVLPQESSTIYQSHAATPVSLISADSGLQFGLIFPAQKIKPKRLSL
jgi:hypothetical protein